MSWDAKATYPRSPRVNCCQAIAIGLGAGAAGAVAMLVTSKLEQLITHRPNSYVPARALSTHLGLYGTEFASRNWVLLNHAHHFGMGVLMAPLRAAMSYYGVIGLIASYIFTGLRLAGDQIVETTAGVSAAPWKWPINEQVVDLMHKTVYAFVVGYLTDKYVRGVEWFNRG